MFSSPARPHTCPLLQPHSAPCSLRRTPCLWTCCSFCLEFPCPPGELLVLQDSAQTAPSRRLPCPFPSLCLPWVPRPTYIGPPLGLLPTHGVEQASLGLHHQTEPLQGQGLSLSLYPTAHPHALPTGALGWCAGGWVSEQTKVGLRLAPCGMRFGG